MWLLSCSCSPLSWPIGCSACKEIDDKKRRKAKQLLLCPKWSTNITIQLQVLSVHTLASWLHMLQCINKNRSLKSCLTAKYPKHKRNCDYWHTRKPVVFFLLYLTGVDFSSHNNAANLGTLAKVLVSAQFAISCIHQEIIDSTRTSFVCL